MSIQKNILKILNNRVFQHILFWSFFLFMEVSHYIERKDEVEMAYFFIKFMIRMFGVAFAVYVNLRILIPYLLNKGKTIQYFVTIIVLILIVSYPGSYFISEYFEGLGPIDRPRPWFAGTQYLISVMISLFLVTLTSLLHLTKEWVKLKDLKIELEKTAGQKLQSELQALKAQINPHFLFNTLNNIYSLSLNQSTQTPGTILKLSDLMSYILYDSSEDLVDIKNEIDFLQNYIALEKIRVDDSVDVRVNIDKNLMGIRIAPLLFISFIENAFKHCPKTGNPKPFIEISMQLQWNRLIFQVINSSAIDGNGNDIKHKGIGMDNVKKRLALLYPGKYSLDINEEEKIFEAKLTLELNHEG
jgi:sensor histidine kinase YesM